MTSKISRLFGGQRGESRKDKPSNVETAAQALLAAAAADDGEEEEDQAEAAQDGEEEEDQAEAAQDDEEDDDEDQAAEDGEEDDEDQAAQANTPAGERARITAILRSEPAKGRAATALALALDTDLKAADAIKVLAATPKGGSRGDLAERMSKVTQPKVGAGGGADGDDSVDAVAARLAGHVNPPRT